MVIIIYGSEISVRPFIKLKVVDWRRESKYLLQSDRRNGVFGVRNSSQNWPIFDKRISIVVHNFKYQCCRMSVFARYRFIFIMEYMVIQYWRDYKVTKNKVNKLSYSQITHRWLRSGETTNVTIYSGSRRNFLKGHSIYVFTDKIFPFPPYYCPLHFYQ